MGCWGGKGGPRGGPGLPLPVVLVLAEGVIIGVVGSRRGDARMRRAAAVLRLQTVLQRDTAPPPSAPADPRLVGRGTPPPDPARAPPGAAGSVGT